ncbi:unnamed protein product [Closterium sp. Yama58-4]|nr:unnamed protein product [Closterium sp. Yama58-4]
MALYESYRQRFKLSARGGGPLTHSPDARILVLVDDYDDRQSESTNLAPDGRISLFFEQFGCESYPYLRKRRLAMLSKAPIRGTLEDWLASSDRFAGKWDNDPKNDVTRMFHGGDDEDRNGVASGATNTEDNREGLSHSNDTNGWDCKDSREIAESTDALREARFLNAIQQPLTAALDLVREKLQHHAVSAAEGVAVTTVGAAADNGFRRVKLLVRLGKLLFSAHGNRNRLTKVPPFSAKRLEDYMSGSEQQLKLPIHRVFETHVPDSVCGALEEIVLRDSGLACKSSEKYDIQVLDTWSRVIYRASCIYDDEKQRLFIKKVKKFPVRYGVFEIARPGKALDVRLILTVETHLPTLDEALGAAFHKVLEAAQFDPESPGGVRIPEHMIEGQKGFDVTSMECDSSSSDSEDTSRIGSSYDVSTRDSEVSSRFSANSTVNTSGGSSSSEESGRFQVRAVRHLSVRRVQAEGRLWKFSRVDGIEYKQGGGRKTNIVEVCPALWQQQLKGHVLEPACSKEQQQHPSWTSEHIISECPALLAWLAWNLQ